MAFLASLLSVFQIAINLSGDRLSQDTLTLQSLVR